MNTKTIGVWGLGVVGKSVINFLQTHSISPAVISKNYSPEDIFFLQEKNITPYHQETDLETFLATHDIIIPSPGIDLRPYAHYAHKWLFEIDLLQQKNNTPTIAITGTLGKTSLTHLLGQLLTHAHKKIVLGGNIGTGMLDLLMHKEPSDYRVLELSSFQLEHCKTFAPDLAVITNIYPNHLDRHGTLEEYTQAKYKILAHQQKTQHALLPLELYESVTAQFPSRVFSFFTLTQPTNITHHTYYYIKDTHIVKQTGTEARPLIPLEQLPPLSFTLNWVILASILDMLTYDPTLIITPTAPYDLPQHRIDAPLTAHGLHFYNDSKSTLMQATLAAVAKMPSKPILLFGGLSKGVNRTELLPLLKNKVKHLVCFGKEAEQLAQAAKSIDMPACAHATLDEAFAYAVASAQKDDCILLSPGGSSYDLFTDYKERGAYFEELVKQYGEKKC